MMSYAFLIACIQICFFQTVFTQAIGPGGPGYGYPKSLVGPGYPGPGLVEPLPGRVPFGVEPLGLGTYGGAGVGEVNVIGELPVAGTTVVAGQVPILGAVEFSGLIPAGGIISVSGTCSCGCGFNGPFVY